MSRGEPVIETIFAGTDEVAANPYQTEPGAGTRAAHSVGEPIAEPRGEMRS